MCLNAFTNSLCLVMSVWRITWLLLQARCAPQFKEPKLGKTRYSGDHLRKRPPEIQKWKMLYPLEQSTGDLEDCSLQVWNASLVKRQVINSSLLILLIHGPHPRVSKSLVSSCLHTSSNYRHRNKGSFHECLNDVPADEFVSFLRAVSLVGSWIKATRLRHTKWNTMLLQTHIHESMRPNSM